MNIFTKHIIYVCKKPLMKFYLCMQVNFVKELETSFWDFVHKFLVEMILWNLLYRNDIYSIVHYIIFIFMVQYPRNG